MDWVPGFTQRPRGHNGFFQAPGPPCLLLHTMEGSFWGGVSTLEARHVEPQLAVGYEERAKVQFWPLSQPGRSLADKGGGVVTNRRHQIVQVELAGFAGQSHTWSDDKYRWLAEALRPVVVGLGILPDRLLRDGRRFHGAWEGTIASPHAFQRFPGGYWNAYGGICGHQHAPENDHWDPGAFDLARFIAFLGASTAPAPGPAPSPRSTPRRRHDVICFEYGGYWHWFWVDAEGGMWWAFCTVAVGIRGAQVLPIMEAGRCVPNSPIDLNINGFKILIAAKSKRAYPRSEAIEFDLTKPQAEQIHGQFV